MRIEPASADYVAPGRRRADAPDTREERAGQQERCPHPATKLLVELVLQDRRSMNLDVVGPDPLGLDSDVVQKRDHRLEVDDTRNVVQRDWLGGERAGGKDRQGTVLVAGRPDASL